MKFFRTKVSALSSHYTHRWVCDVDFPHPVLERGWLHGRELRRAWHFERIAERLGANTWLSYHRADETAPVGSPRLRPASLAGFWPSGGFIELLMNSANQLEDHPRGLLCVFAESPEKCTAVFAELLAGYVHPPESSAGCTRIGLLNETSDGIELKRIAISDEQIVARDTAHLYYGDAITPWVADWTKLLVERRYGLTVLTGAPGTGKTTLIRSLAHWLAETHLFYFMPASRFVRVDSGSIVSFWTEENRTCRLRKVLILEDAESVLQRREQDNREKVATLLNLTDGMLGDALGLHVICTLNCGLPDLDPALLRPGRLVGHREFGPLPLDEARRLASYLERPTPTGPATLAEIVHAEQPPILPRPTDRRVLGFPVARA